MLTDNYVLVLENGQEGVVYNGSNGLAFDALRQNGVPTYIISTEISPVVQLRAGKLSVCAITGLSNKSDAVKKFCRRKNYKLEKSMVVANDVNDLSVMSVVGFLLQ